MSGITTEETNQFELFDTNGNSSESTETSESYDDSNDSIDDREDTRLTSFDGLSFDEIADNTTEELRARSISTLRILNKCLNKFEKVKHEGLRQSTIDRVEAEKEVLHLLIDHVVNEMIDLTISDFETIYLALRMNITNLKFQYEYSKLSLKVDYVADDKERFDEYFSKKSGTIREIRKEIIEKYPETFQNKQQIINSLDEKLTKV